MTTRDHFRTSLIVAGAMLALVVPAAQAKNVHALYDFQNPADGAYPMAAPIMDKAGNLYGTTLEGGTAVCAGGGCGTIFKLAPNGTKITLYSFNGGVSDGSAPYGLVMDAAGNLYGTTTAGGGTGCFDEAGCGTLFEFSSDGVETILHAFTGGGDGGNPQGTLIIDSKGNLYGTTQTTVFKFSPDQKEKVIASGYPRIGAVTLVRDKAGNFYGTTEEGGEYGYGTVFKVASDGTKTIIYAFTGGSDGGGPYAGVIFDGAGNLYGTTPYDGDASCDYGQGCGTVFKIAADGTETTLYTFTDTGANANPMAGVVMDGAGNLYGTTYGFSPGGVFKLASDGTEKLIYTFTGGTDGEEPLGGLLMDKHGNLYGTTQSGGGGTCNNGFGCGAVFELRK